MTARARELREQWQLSLPLALSYLAQNLMGLVDTAMLGRYSEQALAGAGIGNSLVFVLTVFGVGAVMGMDTLVPQALGAGEAGRARQLLAAGLRLCVWIGVPLVAITALTPLLLPLAGVEPAVVSEARTYVLWRLPAMVPFLLFTALRSYLQANGATRVIVIATIVGNIVNVIADATLIFGVDALGIPALGSAGAAIATSVVTIAMAALLGLAVAGLAREADDGSVARPDAARRILRLGLPVGLQLTAEVGLFGVAAVLAGTLGTVPAGAHQVALTLASFTFSAVIGIGAATSVRVGRAIGRGDVPGTRSAGITGLVFGAGFMSLTALVFLLFPAPLARLFTDDEVIVNAAVPLLRIAAVFQLSDGAQAIAAGALRGAGDTRSPLYGNLIGHYLIGFPVMLALAFSADLGAPGLWWGLSAGLTATAVALTIRFLAISSRPIARA